MKYHYLLLPSAYDLSMALIDALMMAQNQDTDIDLVSAIVETTNKTHVPCDIRWIEVPVTPHEFNLTEFKLMTFPVRF